MKPSTHALFAALRAIRPYGSDGNWSDPWAELFFRDRHAIYLRQARSQFGSDAARSCLLDTRAALACLVGRIGGAV